MKTYIRHWWKPWMHGVLNDGHDKWVAQKLTQVLQNRGGGVQKLSSLQKRTFQVAFLSTGNERRGQFAECLEGCMQSWAESSR